ncbi:MAG: hypothetical protein VXZ99_17730, partial [Pseudomonadota bacterium]|nr:hypothetical protein [Pseudomonadota bacterium]
MSEAANNTIRVVVCVNMTRGPRGKCHVFYVYSLICLSVSSDECSRCVYRRGNIDQCAVWRMRPSAAQLPLAGRGVQPYVPSLIGAWPSG